MTATYKENVHIDQAAAMCSIVHLGNNKYGMQIMVTAKPRLDPEAVAKETVPQLLLECEAPSTRVAMLATAAFLQKVAVRFTELATELLYEAG